MRYTLPRRAFNVAAGLLLALVLSAGSLHAEAKRVRILALGDSLTAGFGLADAQGFVPQLQAALEKAGVPAEVINAGVSGDTTAGGLARLDWALADKPDFVVVELGANDALRGLDPAAAESNLDAILTRLKAENIPVLLTGMLAPPNLGADYATAFNGLYGRLAQKHGVPLYPFFLEGIAARAELNQGDGIHPNPQGVQVIVRSILPQLLQALQAAGLAPAKQQG